MAILLAPPARTATTCLALGPEATDVQPRGVACGDLAVEVQGRADAERGGRAPPTRGEAVDTAAQAPGSFNLGTSGLVLPLLAPPLVMAES